MENNNENPEVEATGHPAEGTVIEGETPSVEETPSEPLYKGVKGEITDPKELAEYTRELEKTTIALAARQETSAEPANPPPVKKSWEEEVKENWYTDPDKAVATLRQGILGEITSANNQKAQADELWKQFYSENPDLKKYDRAVRSVMTEKRGEFAKLDVKTFKAKLAKDSREYIASIRGEEEVVTELPAGGATIVSSGNKRPAGGGGKPPAPKTFVQQVNDVRARKHRS